MGIAELEAVLRKADDLEGTFRSALPIYTTLGVPIGTTAFDISSSDAYRLDLPELRMYSML
jgi:hypothetical protein